MDAMTFACIGLGSILAAGTAHAVDWWLQQGDQLRRDTAELIRLRRLDRDLAELLEDE